MSNTEELKSIATHGRRSKPAKKPLAGLSRKKLALIAGGAVVVMGVAVALVSLKVIPEAQSYASFEVTNDELCEAFVGAGLSCAVEWVPDDSRERGALIGQDHEAGSLALLGSSVELSYSRGPAKSEMPDLRNLTLDEARQELYSLGVSVGSIEEVDEASLEAGRVVGSSVAVGETVTNGEELVLQIASGESLAPAWLGKTRATVETEATLGGLKVTFTEEGSEEPVGTVLSQIPAAGERVGEEGVVLVVAKSPEATTLTVPDVIGLSADDAQNQLAQAGFRNISPVVVKSSQVTSPQVTQVVPGVGTEAEGNSLLVLVVTEPE